MTIALFVLALDSAPEIDWLTVASKTFSLVALVVLPMLAKRNVRLARVLRAVVLGVEDADHPETKASIQAVATEHGVQQDLHQVVQTTTRSDS